MKSFNLTSATKREFDTKINTLLSSNPNNAYVVTIANKGKKRSLSVNAQEHIFYAEIAKQKEDETPLQIKNQCKVMFGVPLLLNSEAHGDKLLWLLDKLSFFKYSYESQCKVIQCVSVTSLLTPKESKQYMDNMISFYGENGIVINYQEK